MASSDARWHDHPLHTYDCAWCCGVDLLRCRRREVGHEPIDYDSFPAGRIVTLDATVYEVDAEAIGGRLRGHVAVAEHMGGKVVWNGMDLAFTEEHER